MDDVWGNAWSTPGPSSGTEADKSTSNGPKWNYFERDADDETVDVGIPSWTGPSVGWAGTQPNLWHSEPPTLDTWGSNVDRHASDAENEEPEEPEEPLDHLQTDDGKGVSSRPILPTPPQSPLILPSPPASPAVEEAPPSSPARTTPIPDSPDPFGSFESAEVAHTDFRRTPSWEAKPPDFPDEITDECWGGAWGTQGVAKGIDEGVKDEWEIAQEAKRRQERKVPPQLLGSLVTQWNEYAKEFSRATKSDDIESQSWRKGMDNVEGLTDLVESLVPAASFPPLAQFSVTSVSKALQESLRLTRSFSLTRSSPMAHLYASKGSTDWEQSVKAQKTAANDEWGWDLKQELEDTTESTDVPKEKKGLLSFWGRKASTNPGASTSEQVTPSQPKSLTVSTALGSPSTSAPSTEVPLKTTSVTPTPEPPLSNTASTVAPAVAVETISQDGLAVQPSAVSRFFNRFSRKPSSVTASSTKDNRSSLSFTEDDLSVLSDGIPSTSGASKDSRSGNSSLLHGGHDSTRSLEEMLISQVPPTGSPPPLVPRPVPSNADQEPAKNTAPNSSFDVRISNVNFLNILEDMGQPSSRSGYAPVSFDLIDSPEEPMPPTSILQSPAVSAPTRPTFSTPPLQQTLQTSSWFTGPNPGSRSVLPPPLPPPIAPSRQEARVLAPVTPPPPSPLRRSLDKQRRDSPLPPMPQHGISDFSVLLATPLSPQSHAGVSPLPATPDLFTGPSLSSASSADFGDFGDFGDFVSPPISPPVQSPPPPHVPRKTSRAADHRPTMQLVEKAASMTGQWPAPQQPLPKPLAPPPGDGYSGASVTQQAQRDLLSDDLPLEPRPASGVLIEPPLSQSLFTGSLSRPASVSASTSGMAPQLLAMPPVRPVSTTPSLFNAVAPGKPSVKSGLSAQDLSFFEGL